MSLLARIGVLYAIAPRTIERIPRGTDTQNWRIDTDDALFDQLPAIVGALE